MTAPEAPRRRLPDRPSEEFLRKQAKRLAKAESLALASAQRRLAADYDFSNWSALMRAVAGATSPKRSALSLAASRADEAEVRALLQSGAKVDGEAGETDTPLFCVCDSNAKADSRIAVARLLIEAGAFVRAGCTDGATPLHAAARQGPAELVELLMRNGALFWQACALGRRACAGLSRRHAGRGRGGSGGGRGRGGGEGDGCTRREQGSDDAPSTAGGSRAARAPH